MHRSAIGAIGIDIPAGGIDRASEFWGAALGRATRTGITHGEYRVVDGAFGGLTVFLQSVGDDQPRVHLDVHTDDLDAEVSRLVSLGATELGRHGGWVVLEDPTGLVFCVVPVRADDPLLDGAEQFGD